METAELLLLCFAKQAPSAAKLESSGIEAPMVCVSESFSRPININRVDLAVMATHIKGDWTTAHFAILNGRKCAGRSIYDRSERRSAVGAGYLRLYFEFHGTS